MPTPPCLFRVFPRPPVHGRWLCRGTLLAIVLCVCFLHAIFAFVALPVALEDDMQLRTLQFSWAETPMLMLRGAIYRKPRKHSGSATMMAAGPPTMQAPPPTDEATVTDAKRPWAECVVRHEKTAPGLTEPSVGSMAPLEVETESCEEIWVFRMEHVDDFARLLQVRSSDISQASAGLPGDDERWRQCPIAASVHCSERRADPSIRCAECIRLMRGGPYPDWGILAPSYPPAPAVMNCLNQTRELPPGMELGNPQQIAFCNSVNSRFPVL
eukprot:TRINITY_DN91380_c0_g1_i1.p1 TRINITY_DN91380_c0_g1~~TRINITY_DN91380_c0_g1_i1.p1  ORF type:complete len:282 (+),score=23.68 TRINITY_DN91380_c0_g1_i1:37-846(+)